MRIRYENHDSGQYLGSVFVQIMLTSFCNKLVMIQIALKYVQQTTDFAPLAI